MTHTSRIWKRWKDERPPNAPGTYRYRVTTEILGMVLTPEWNEEMRRCGTGYGEDEFWPVSPSHWNGARRHMMEPTIEWTEARDDDPEGVVWGGLDLSPCPFTGKPPRVEYLGRYITAPPFHVEWLGLESHLVKSNGWRNAQAMQEAWNTRAAPTAEKVT